MAAIQGIPQSSDTIFIRGFSTRHHVEDIRNFFTREGGRNSVEFVKETPDGEGFFLALKFESKSIARDVLNRFDGVEVLGDHITIVWYKDIRKAQNYASYERNSGTGNYRRGAWHAADSRYDYRSGPFRSGGRGSAGAYYGASRGGSYYGAGRGGGSDYVTRSRRRMLSRSKSRSASRSKSRSRSSSQAHSDDSRSRKHRRSASDSGRRAAAAGQQSKGKVTVDGEGRESAECSVASSAHSDTETPDSNRKKRRRAASDSKQSPHRESPSHRHRTASDGRESDAEPPAAETHVLLRSTVTHAGRTTVALQSTADQQIAAGELVMPLSRDEELPESGSKPVSNDDRSVTSEILCRRKQRPPAPVAAAGAPSQEDYEDMANEAFHKSASALQEPSMSSNIKGNHYSHKLTGARDIGALGLTSDKMALVREKKDDIEKAYRQDCETFATVTKMLINKDAGLEDRIQFSLRENLKDIGKRCIHELRSFIDGLRTEMDDEECF